MTRSTRPALILFTVCMTLSKPGYTQSSIDLNFGLSPSKSLLGISYTHNKNQFNIGLHGLGYSGRDGVLVQPGLAYNRYLTNNGFYASASYNAVYLSQDIQDLTYDMGTSQFSYVTTERKGWHSGNFMLGLGKSWQFTSWGLHTDAGFGTPSTSDFGRSWGLYLGAAASYRFNLD
jgi:hypothetical protein